MAVHGRFLKAAAAASIIAVVAAGCSSGGGEDGEQADAGTSGVGPITFAMGKNDTDKLRPVIEQWNAEHPDQVVTLHELAGEADAQRDTLVQSLQTQSGEYDAFALDVTDTAYFAANGWLQPIQGDTEVDTSGLIEAAVDSATYNGTLYAVPQNTNAQLLYYRTDLQPEAPANWGALVDSCKVAAEAAIDCLNLQLKQYEGLTVAATQFIHSWGGQVVGSDGKTPELDTPEAKAGMTALVDGYKSDIISMKSDGFTEEETAQAFLGGRSLYAYNWPYMYESGQTDPTSQVQGKFNVAPILGPDGAGRSTLGGYNNAINVFSENKATVKAFLEFIISEDVQMGFAQESFPPVLASIYDDEALQQEFPYMTALKAALENAQPRPVTPFYPAVSKAIQDNTFAALKDQKTVEQALTDMSAAIQQAQ
ncbi:ABC transporter substrate-binding protein [uncultured Dietzia sp.]|jgi:multiple sugar transport system substrate-binding protein|uniref:ABC transporter substrate-binding protein n=1 Tax=uncultured Dietzia sp. TaxID=395519 RepID=UPI0026126AD2|nr:ABC transporter substrate-binding protein [uncultured Dietzia sp.]HMT48573.1 ABC transporter substrate-binding protein [Dietzia sp.]